MKFASIPKDEPIYEIIQSRVINTSKIKDKAERKYWNNLKRIHRIPDLYMTTEEILEDMSKNIKEKRK